MKIIQLTDTHLLGADRANVYGMNPAHRLKRAIKSINQIHGDAKFIVITGDLAHQATPEAYKLLQKIIKKSDIPVYPILGNHDIREYFSESFPEYMDKGFCQYTKKVGGRVFLFLDTLVENRRFGKLCDERLSWLGSKLEKYKKMPVYLFMHHHPAQSGMYEMDHLADFRTRKPFWNLINKYNNVKHITFGHLHRIVHMTKGPISMHSTRSTTFQVMYSPNVKKEYLTNKERPTYAIMEIGQKETLRIHHHEYLYEKHYYEDGSRFDDQQ